MFKFVRGFFRIFVGRRRVVWRRWAGSFGDGVRLMLVFYIRLLFFKNLGVIIIKIRCRGEWGLGEVFLGRNIGIKRN